MQQYICIVHPIFWSKWCLRNLVIWIFWRFYVLIIENQYLNFHLHPTLGLMLRKKPCRSMVFGPSSKVDVGKYDLASSFSGLSQISLAFLLCKILLIPLLTAKSLCSRFTHVAVQIKPTLELFFSFFSQFLLILTCFQAKMVEIKGKY